MRMERKNNPLKKISWGGLKAENNKKLAKCEKVKIS